MATREATVTVQIDSAIGERTGLSPVEMTKAAAWVAACKRYGVSLDAIQAAVYATHAGCAEQVRDEYIRLMTGQPVRKVIGE